jgi:hypothetical protein
MSHQLTALCDVRAAGWGRPGEVPAINLRKAFYAADAANRHVNPHWSRTKCDRLAELLREQIRQEHTTAQALADGDAFTATIPTALTSAHTYLTVSRPHAFTCLDPAVRKALARLGGPELGTGVLGTPDARDQRPHWT